MSLLETLLASANLATGLLSLAQVLGLASSATAAAGRTTRSALLASQKVEEVRAFPSPPLGQGGDDPAPGYRREWTVVPLPSDPEHLVLVEVVVRVRGRDTRFVALAPRPAP